MKMSTDDFKARDGVIMAEFENDGAVIHYEVTGEGENTIVFVHGHPFDRTMWVQQAVYCTELGWRSVLLDLRGYGASTRTDKTAYEFGQFARDIEALLDRLGLSRCVLCGLSMGGQIVMDCCERYSERICGVILVATTPQAETAQSRRDRLAMVDRLEREGIRPYANEVLARMLAPKSISEMPDVAEFVLEMMQNSDPFGAAAAQRARADRPSYEPTLSKLEVPTLIVVGDSDAFTSRSDAQLMNDLVARSELLWMSDVGHMPNLERTTEFNIALGNFLCRVAAQKGEGLSA